MKNKIILFDIDYTLFDTDKYRDMTYPQLMKYLKQEDTPAYHERVSQIEKEIIKKGYEPVAFAKTIAQALSIEPEHDALEKLFYDKNLYTQCLYPEAEDTLQKLSKREDIILGIISKGELTFQDRKIEAIRHFFSEADIHISLNKIKEFQEIFDRYKDTQLFIVDDSAPFLYEVKKQQPKAIVVLVEKENRYERRPVAKEFVADNTITNLTEIEAILDKE